MDFTFQGLVKHVTEVIKQPELHMREIPILVGLAILIVFILFVLIAIIFVRPGERKRGKIEEKEFTRQLRRSYGWIVVFGAVGTLSFAIASSNAAKPAFCGSCHEMSQAYRDAQHTTHARVGCLSCHQEPGVTGAIIEKLRFVEMLAAKSRVIGSVTSTEVTNGACLRCHQRTLVGVKEVGSIRMKHAEPIDAGYRCLDCHYSKPTFHVNRRKLDPFDMSRCVDCHNQAKASAKCDVCHTRGGVGKSRADRSDYPRATVTSTPSCRLCHATSQCLDCHKLQLPHSPEWTAGGGHALQAFVEKKLCWQCHGKRDCRKCHPGVFPHPDDWIRQHGMMSKGTTATCVNCHNTPTFCVLCHVEPAGGILKPNLFTPPTPKQK